MANNDTNRIVIIGRLTRDSDISYTPGGMAISHISIAVNRNVKKGDTYEQEANYFDAKIFGKTAENLKSYLTKGKQVALDGYLHQERWEKDGESRSRVVINVNEVQLIGGNKDGGSQNQDNGGYGYGN